MKVDIKADWRFPVDRLKLRQAVNRVMAEFKVKEAVVNIVIVGDRKMAGLNKKWLKREGTTDVLSFPMEGPPLHKATEGHGFVMPPDAPLYLGDVVVSWPQAVKQASQKNVMVDMQVEELVEHGVKHLLGIHHE